MSTIEYLWRVSQQLIVAKDNEMKQICGFGSGFFILHHNNLFFITADHVLHGDDHDFGLRISEEDKLFIVNNIKGEGISSAYTPVGDFYFFDKYNFADLIEKKDDDLEVLTISELQDYTFCLRKNKFDCPFYTHELADFDGNVIVPNKLEKLIINSEEITEPNNADYYIVAGCVRCKVVDGVRIDRSNAIHQDMRYKQMKDNRIILQSSERMKYDDWAGLSGSPILNQDGLLLGVAVAIYEETNELAVVPIKEILEKMDYVVKLL